MSRERLRSRFRLGLAVGLALLLGACADHFGFGLAELPADRGWEPLPIREWVLNDGLDARAMLYCPRETCASQGVAALLAFSGREGRDMERALAADPARLARAFSQPNAQDKRGRAASPAKPPAAKSTTRVERYRTGGAAGLLVEIAAKDGRRSAATAILYARDGDALLVAIAVSENPALARGNALATWNSR